MITEISSLLRTTHCSEGVLAVAGAQNEEVLKAVCEAFHIHLARPVLIGKAFEIESLLCKIGEKPSDYEIKDKPSDKEASREAVCLAACGKADCLMKGNVPTSVLMYEVLKKDSGIKHSDLMSHIMLYEIENYPKVLAITDGALTPFPTLFQKAQILENAAVVLKKLEYEEINAACVCRSEIVNDKIQAYTDAEKIVRMKNKWEPYSMNVFGPVGFDLAISKEACKRKNYIEKGGGEADLILVSNYETGNCIGKSLTYFANAKSAGVVIGAKVPIVLISRSDNSESELASIALGIRVGEKKF